MLRKHGNEGGLGAQVCLGRVCFYGDSKRMGFHGRTETSEGCLERGLGKGGLVEWVVGIKYVNSCFLPGQDRQKKG